MKTKIVASESWNGFTFTFSNGWSISIQQSKSHNCTVGESAEVAIFDPDDFWFGYDQEKREIFKPNAETYVNGWLDANEVAKIISIISQKRVDFRTSE